MSGATGRERFRRMLPIIKLLSLFFRRLPVGIRRAIWRSIDGWSSVLGVGLRYCLLRTLAKSCGDNVMIGSRVELRGVDKLVVGNNVSIHTGCYIDAAGGVTIGDDVSIAHASSILSFEHTWNDPLTPIKYNPTRLAPVTIGNDVWIGCGCRILAGVHIHSRAVVAAGAVVNRDVERGRVVGGVPAKVLRVIPTGDAITDAA